MSWVLRGLRIDFGQRKLDWDRSAVCHRPGAGGRVVGGHLKVTRAQGVVPRGVGEAAVGERRLEEWSPIWLGYKFGLYWNRDG